MTYEGPIRRCKVLGKGKINIRIPKTNYAPGDIVSGDVALNLKKPMKARELSISLIGEQRIVQGGGIRGGERSENKQRVYDFKQQLDEEREYEQDRAYHFEMKIPADILSGLAQMPQIGGKVGQGVKVMQALVGVNKITRWYLLAKLDIPGGIDVKKEVQITIG
jgi:hypothetical protein